MTTPANFTPTGYSWIYGSAPQVEDIPCAQRYNVSIELVTVPPEGANINGAEFTVGITLATVTPLAQTITSALRLACLALNHQALISPSPHRLQLVLHQAANL
jgi:hypothetical protein